MMMRFRAGREASASKQATRVGPRGQRQVVEATYAVTQTSDDRVTRPRNEPRQVATTAGRHVLVSQVPVLHHTIGSNLAIQFLHAPIAPRVPSNKKKYS